MCTPTLVIYLVEKIPHIYYYRLGAIRILNPRFVCLGAIHIKKESQRSEQKPE